MTKTIRYALIVIVLAVVALLAAPFFIDVNSYKSQIEQQVEDATGRKLTIGSISASIFPWIGVELEDVHLANRSGFADRDFASVKKLNVSLALLPLLSKQVEIQAFEIDSPDIYLERHEDGQTNWGDLAKSEASAEQPATAAQQEPVKEAAKQESAAPLLAALKAETLSLTDATFTWADAGQQPLKVTELNVLIKDLQLEHPVSFAAAGKLSGNAFETEAMVGPLGDLAKLDPMKLPLQGRIKVNHLNIGSFKSMISGWPEQLGPIDRASIGFNANIEHRPDGMLLAEGQTALISAVNLGLDWKLDMASPDKLDLRHANINVNGKNVAQIQGSVSQLDAEPKFNLHIDGQPLERTWIAAFVPELNRMYAKHPAPWSQIALASRISGNAKQLNISDMQLMLDKEQLHIAGSVRFDGPDIRLRITGNELHLDPWLPQAEEGQAAATPGSANAQPAAQAASTKGAAAAPAQASAEPDLRFLTPWRVAARMNVGALHLRGMKMEQFNVNIDGDKGHFKLNPLNFRLSGGTVSEHASLDASRYPAHWNESVQVSNVQVGPLLKSLADMDLLEGALNMETALRGGGLTPAATNTLNGRGKFAMKNGKIKGYDIAGAIRRVTNPMAQSTTQDTDFTELTGSFNVKDGVASNNDLFLASPLLRITGNGIVDLVQKQLDYHLKPQVVGTLIGQGDSSPVRKGVTIPLHIKGPLDGTPSIKPEINAKTLMQNAPALINKGKAGGIVDKLLGGQQSQPAPDQSAPDQNAPAPQETPQQKLLKGLGGALGF